MSRGSFLNDALYDYLLRATLAPEPLLDRLRDETTEKTGQWAGMQISRDQGRFMQVLVRLMGARKYLEVGTFTGYSALVVAQALPDDGRVVWGGSVANPEKQDENTVAIRTLNEKIRDDPRVYSVLVSIGDGLTMAVKL